MFIKCQVFFKIKFTKERFKKNLRLFFLTHLFFRWEFSKSYCGFMNWKICIMSFLFLCKSSKRNQKLAQQEKFIYFNNMDPYFVNFIISFVFFTLIFIRILITIRWISHYKHMFSHIFTVLLNTGRLKKNAWIVKLSLKM